jgi:hypothetical protein
MNVLCSATACPVLLSTTCVFYEGENLIYTGINTNDSVQEALQKIDEAFSNNILSINAILPISVTSGPNPTISISQASATSNGYISSVDWNIFNNKVPSTRTLTINGTTYDLSADRTWTIPSDNIYNIDGTLTGNRIVTLNEKQLVYRSNPSVLQNYTFNIGTPTGITAPTWPSSVIFEGEYLMSTANAEPYNTRVWGRNQTSGLRSFWVNQAYADITGESTGGTNIYNQVFSTRRGSITDTSTTTTATMRGVMSEIGHRYGFTSATQAVINTTNQEAFFADNINYTGNITNVFSYFARNSVGAGNTPYTTNVTNYYGFYQLTFVVDSKSTITNHYGLFLSAPILGTGGIIINRWGLYAPDIAMNHYINGTFLIGTTTPSTFKLDVNGTARVSGLLTLGVGISGPATTYFDGPGTTGDLFVRYTNVDLPKTTTTQLQSSYFRATSNSTFTSGAGIEIAYTSNIGFIFAIDRTASSQKPISINAFGSNVIIGDFTDVASAQLQVTSTTKGFLQPRMTTVQRDAIVSPATGLQVYNSTTNTNDYYNGTSWLSEGNVSGSGVAGQVAYWNGTGSVTGSNNLFWDAANSRLGIGTNSPLYRLHNVGTSAFDAGASGDAITLLNNGFLRWTSVRLRAFSTSFDFQDNAYSTKVSLSMSGSASIFNTGGNFLFGTATDGGQRLQVQGDAFIKGSGNTSATIALQVQNSLGGNMLRVRNDGQTIIQGVTNNDTSVVLQVSQANGNGRFAVSANGQTVIGGDSFQATENFVNIARNPFNPTSGSTTHTSLFISPTINQTGGANGITRGLYVNPTLTAAADWRSIEWSNNTGWGLYGAGTALNYLGGSLGIKTTSPYSPSTFSLDVNGGLLVKNTAGTTAQITLINANPALGGNEGFIVHSVGGTSTSSFAQLQGYYGLSIAGSTAIRLNPLGGSVIVNSTTNSGEQFQVTGDARITGTIYQDGAADALFNFQNAGANKWRIGNAFVSGSNYFQLYDSVSNLERIRWNNNSTATFTSDITFIGGSNAVATFQSTQPDVKIQASGASNAVSLSLVPSNGFEGVIQNNVTNGFIQVKTASTTRVTFKNGGQVNFQPLAADPAGAGAGDVYYNSGTNKLRLYDGTSWVDLN